MEAAAPSTTTTPLTTNDQEDKNHKDMKRRGVHAEIKFAVKRAGGGGGGGGVLLLVGGVLIAGAVGAAVMAWRARRGSKKKKAKDMSVKHDELPSKEEVLIDDGMVVAKESVCAHKFDQNLSSNGTEITTNELESVCAHKLDQNLSSNGTEVATDELDNAAEEKFDHNTLSSNNSEIADTAREVMHQELVLEELETTNMTEITEDTETGVEEDIVIETDIAQEKEEEEEKATEEDELDGAPAYSSSSSSSVEPGAEAVWPALEVIKGEADQERANGEVSKLDLNKGATQGVVLAMNSKYDISKIFVALVLALAIGLALLVHSHTPLHLRLQA